MKNCQKIKTKSNYQYYMYGKHSVLAALANKSRKIIQVYCLPQKINEAQENIPESLVKIVDNNFINSKIGNNLPHQGIIALVETVFIYNLNSINFSSNKIKVAILDQITDPQNIGAIIRSAAAFGINFIIMTKNNAPSENAIIAKAACGCLELVTIIVVTNLNNTINKLKTLGFWVAGLDTSGTDSLQEINNIDKIACIIGSEGKGMRKLTAQSCDFRIKIPISNNVESLNASNAAAIIFYLIQQDS